MCHTLPLDDLQISEQQGNKAQEGEQLMTVLSSLRTGLMEHLTAHTAETNAQVLAVTNAFQNSARALSQQIKSGKPSQHDEAGQRQRLEEGEAKSALAIRCLRGQCQDLKGRLLYHRSAVKSYSDGIKQMFEGIGDRFKVQHLNNKSAFPESSPQIWYFMFAGILAA